MVRNVMKRTVSVFLILTLCFAMVVLSSCGKKEDAVSINETRQTVEAIEGKDYRIDNIVVAIADSENQNGNVQYVSYSELRSILQTKKTLGEAIHCRVTVKYTALRELAGAECGLNLSFWSFQGDGNTQRYYDIDGNSASSQLLKTDNVLVGEHYLSFSFSVLDKEQGYGLNVIENLDTIDEELFFKAYVYVN